MEFPPSCHGAPTWHNHCTSLQPVSRCSDSCTEHLRFHTSAFCLNTSVSTPQSVPTVLAPSTCTPPSHFCPFSPLRPGAARTQQEH